MPSSMHLHAEIYPNLKKYIWIIQNVHEKSRFFYIMIESRATRHSAVSTFTETVEFL